MIGSWNKALNLSYTSATGRKDEVNPIDDCIRSPADAIDDMALHWFLEYLTL